MRRALALLGLVLVVVARDAAAQRGAPRARPALGLGTPTTWTPFLGARYSSVQGISGSLLLLRGHATRDEVHSGEFAAGEVGQRGWSAGLGVGGWAAVAGSSLRATYLRTWGHDGRLAAGQGFVGGEFRVSLRWWTFGGGWYRRVAGSAPGDRSTFVFTAGLGY